MSPVAERDPYSRISPRYAPQRQVAPPPSLYTTDMDDEFVRYEVHPDFGKAGTIHDIRTPHEDAPDPNQLRPPMYNEITSHYDGRPSYRERLSYHDIPLSYNHRKHSPDSKEKPKKSHRRIRTKHAPKRDNYKVRYSRGKPYYRRRDYVYVGPDHYWRKSSKTGDPM